MKVKAGTIELEDFPNPQAAVLCSFVDEVKYLTAGQEVYAESGGDFGVLYGSAAAKSTWFSVSLVHAD